MKVLIVEDEINVASLLKRALEEEGYAISVAMDGHSGYAMATDHDFDLIVLDMMLPGMNGLQICRQLRSSGKNVPVLMLTALGSTENIVSGLDGGADDYLVKPFNINELLARIRSLVRRGQPAGSSPHNPKEQIADLEMDLDAKTVSRAGQPLALTATEYRLLEFLMKNRGRVLSRMDILENVWGIDFNLGTNVVDVYVNYLRKKIDKDFSPRLIHTVIGMGYILKEDENKK